MTMQQIEFKHVVALVPNNTTSKVEHGITGKVFIERLTQREGQQQRTQKHSIQSDGLVQP